MKTLTIQVKLCSHALIGSGEGFGAIIDADIVFDDVGIPYIPAKRIKGCLRDSAMDVQEMFNASTISFPVEIDNTFGITGEKSGQVYFSNLKIEQYTQNYEWLKYLSSAKAYRSLLSRDAIVNAFTTIRQQTAIDLEKGIAEEHSLRTIRVLQKGHTFYGAIHINTERAEDIINTLALACLNLRHLGTKRNRGFGEVECQLLDEHRNKIQVLKAIN